MTVALACIDLHKEYVTRGVVTRALNGVTLTVNAGEFIVLAGPSGCGKSTLLALLGLLEEPTSGQVLVKGQANTQMSDEQRAQLRLHAFGFIYQAFHLIPHLTVIDNVGLPLALQKVPKREIQERAADALNAVRLAEKLDARPDELSGGQQQRVAIARAMVSRPSVVFADEPTGNLDRENGGRIIDILGQANASGAAIIMVTHERTLEHIGDRLIRLVDGTIVGDDRTHRST